MVLYYLYRNICYSRNVCVCINAEPGHPNSLKTTLVLASEVLYPRTHFQFWKSKVGHLRYKPASFTRSVLTRHLRLCMIYKLIFFSVIFLAKLPSVCFLEKINESLLFTRELFSLPAVFQD